MLDRAERHYELLILFRRQWVKLTARDADFDEAEFRAVDEKLKKIETNDGHAE